MVFPKQTETKIKNKDQCNTSQNNTSKFIEILTNITC